MNTELRVKAKNYFSGKVLQGYEQFNVRREWRM